LFAVVFFGDCFLQFAVLRGPQPPSAVDRHFGFRRARCSAGCVRFIQKERTLFKFASFASVGAGVVLVPKPAGRVLRASAWRGFGSHGYRQCLSLQAATAPNIYLSLLPPLVPASCIFQSAAEFANNSVVCHSKEQSDEESV
jgi:hypothetical protein